MAIPFTVDISAFYGEPDFQEQNCGTIVDRRKTLILHKELETPVNAPVSSKRKKRTPKQTPTKSADAIAMSTYVNQGGAVAFGTTKSATGGNCKFGGALAFNEAQLMNELTV